MTGNPHTTSINPLAEANKADVGDKDVVETKATPSGDLDDDEEAYDPDDVLPFCSYCQGSGWENCYCGGDQCYCENQGEKPCEHCKRGLDAF